MLHVNCNRTLVAHVSPVKIVLVYIPLASVGLLIISRQSYAHAAVTLDSVSELK